MMMLVDIMTSSAVFASSFRIKYTICRSEGSLFWKSLEMPKKSVVASFVGNFSPVNRRTAIFVRRVRHFRGDIGEELNNLAGERVRIGQALAIRVQERERAPTILENSGAVKLEHDLISIFVLFNVAHDDGPPSKPRRRGTV